MNEQLLYLRLLVRYEKSSEQTFEREFNEKNEPELLTWSVKQLIE